MKNKYLFYIINGIIIFVVMLLLYISCLLFYPYKPAEFLNVPFPVENDSVYQGEMLRYYIHYNKKMDVPVKVTQTLINHVQINFPPSATRFPVGNYKVVNNDIMIPTFIDPGKAYLMVTFIYHVNPLREITITTRTEDFYILER